MSSGMSGWNRLSDYCIRSPCGEYTICKIGLKDGWRFELWKGRNCVKDSMLTAQEAIRAYTSRQDIRVSSIQPKTGSASAAESTGDQAELSLFTEAS